MLKHANADETTLQVLHEAGRSAGQTSYMWMYRTGIEGPPMILYDYQTTRASKHLADSYLDSKATFMSMVMLAIMDFPMFSLLGVGLTRGENLMRLSRRYQQPTQLHRLLLRKD
jgi:hypothetical protein